MIIGVPKEIKLQEHRIGLTPDSVKVLIDKGDIRALNLYMGYRYGKPKETKDIHINDDQPIFID